MKDILRSDSDGLVGKTAEYVRSLLVGEGSGHDWWHIYRVWKMSVRIAKEENANLLVVELGALLHDIADWKFNDGDEEVGPAKARAWLQSLMVDEEVIAQVCQIVRDISYKGAGVATPMPTIEGQVVQDADRLDAIGAIGIARTFAYGGSKAREMYNPDQSPVLHQSFEQYKMGNGSTINHFYEKLLLLKERMNTATAKRLAQHRHKVMEEFLDEFYLEWEGER
ncbi:HD domain-containing protein [Acetobacteroides hydrogenigenes]|uniref:HD domain-containing protein n=1 Tax=Acetobacteroides hydrogenigenes TaxID=979970 RepID=A0A4R2E5T4_9BACT|nr:HD domain-containing protein [Acetobacteroides hydrogenigenes]TCN62056.1 uncharacterized protein CLV25_12115 [Acetobacteroides hydrogenigenes]